MVCGCVFVGDDLGKIWIYDVGEQLAIPQPDEWNKFAHTLQVSTVPDNVALQTGFFIFSFFQLRLQLRSYIVTLINFLPENCIIKVTVYVQ